MIWSKKNANGYADPVCSLDVCRGHIANISLQVSIFAVRLLHITAFRTLNNLQKNEEKEKKENYRKYKSQKYILLPSGLDCKVVENLARIQKSM